MTNNSLSSEDVSRLLADPSPEARVIAAEKIAIGFSDNTHSAKERQIAEEIFRILLSDAEIRVREALAVNLKDNPTIPHDVALALANDVSRVSVPMLEFSDVLNDEDLIEVIRSQDVAKQTAISERHHVSEIISDTLIDTKNESVVASLIRNEGAQISEGSFEKAVDSLGESELVQTAMVNRSALPVLVTEKLVTLVSDILRDELFKRHEMPDDLATDLLLQSRERAIVTLATESGDEDIRKLVKQMRQNNRLTSSIVLRALCMGDLRFFEAALSELANIPLVNARTLIYDPGFTGLERLWIASNMPKQQLDAVRAAITAVAELEHDGQPQDRQRFSRRLIERVLSQYDNTDIVLETDDLEYLLAKISELPSAEPLAL